MKLRIAAAWVAKIDCITNLPSSSSAASGALTALAGSPFPLGAIPNSAGSLAIDPGGKFLYATDLHGFNVLAFAINGSDGSLTPVPGSPFPSGFDPAGAVVDPSTKFLNVADVGVGSFAGISSYTINSANGALTAGAGGPLVVLLNGGVTDIAMHSSGKFLYVSTGISPTDSGVAAFTVNQTTGGLTQNGSAPFPTGLAPMRITLHSGGKFLYTANSGDGTISGFAIDAASGNLMAVSGSPFRIFAIPPSGGLISFDVAIDPSGQFLYAANPTTNNVFGVSHRRFNRVAKRSWADVAYGTWACELHHCEPSVRGRTNESFEPKLGPRVISPAHPSWCKTLQAARETF